MKHPLQKRWVYGVFVAVRSTLRWLPLRAAQALGRGVGLVAYGVAGTYRRLSYAHLRHAFGPALSDMTCHYVARRTFVNLGKNILEWLVLDRLSPAQIRRVVDVHGAAHLDRALAQGRGVIALSAHFGNWELLAMALARQGRKDGVVARRLRDPEYQAFIWGLRARKGVETWERGSAREIAHTLKQNRIVGMMPDQDMDSLENVFVDFFGHPTATPVGPAALALMTGAALIPCFIVRQGPRFRVQIEAPIAVERTEDRQADLVRITQAWSRVVESYIRRYPDHWVWMHRRWKTPPPVTSEERRAASQPHTPTLKRKLEPVMAVVWALLITTVLTAGCSNAPSKKVQAVPSPEDARAMDTFTVSGYAPDGRKKWDLQGTGASADGSLVMIQRPNAMGYDMSEPAAAPPKVTAKTTKTTKATAAEGPRVTHLTASVAQIDQKSRRIKMEQDVTIHTSEGLWLTTPIMYWLPDRQEMTTDEPVRIETDHFLLYGRQGHGQSQLKTAILDHDIELVLNPTTEEKSGEIQHVTITCDGPLVFEYDKGIATFEHNVHVKDQQGDLYSDTLVAHLNQVTRTVIYADAIGHVRIIQGGNTATGERAIYEPAKTKVTLLGAPSLLVYPKQPSSPAVIPPLLGPAPVPMPRMMPMAAPIAQAPADVGSPKPASAQVASQPNPLTGDP